MKKALFFWFVVLSVLSCGKERPFPPEPDHDPSVTFCLTADYDTKAVKTAWEAGDVIFVFFDNVASPNYLKMSFDGSAWSYTEVGNLGLVEGATGMMRAVYLPFGNTVSVVQDGTGFKFQTAYKSYYLTASLAYTVRDHSVSGNFKMSVPEGYVQFFVEDAEAVDRGCVLSTSAVRPVEIKGVAADGKMVLDADFGPGGNLPGYVYKGGYLFSGVLASPYAYGTNYYFAKTKVSDQTRVDFVARGKTLASHNSVNLPAATSTRWQPVGADVTVSVKTTLDGKTYDCGVWYTCNHGESCPEDLVQSAVTYSVAAAGAGNYHVLPTPALLDRMVASLTWFPMEVYFQEGVVAYASTGAFLFFPLKTKLQDSGLTPPYSAGYWGTYTDSEHASFLYVSAASQTSSITLRGYQYYVRYLYSLPAK